MRTYEVYNTPSFTQNQDIDLCALASQATSEYNCSTLSQSEYYRFTLESSDSQITSEFKMTAAYSTPVAEMDSKKVSYQNGVLTASSHHLGEWQVFIETCKKIDNDVQDCLSRPYEPAFSFEVINPCTELTLNWVEQGIGENFGMIDTSSDAFRETTALRSILSVTPTETYAAAANVAAIANHCELQLELGFLKYTSDDLRQFDFSTYFNLEAASIATDDSVLSQTAIRNIESHFKVSNQSEFNLSELSVALHPASMLKVSPQDILQGQYEVVYKLTVPDPTDDDPGNRIVVSRLPSFIKVRLKTTPSNTALPDGLREPSTPPNTPDTDYDTPSPSPRRLLNETLKTTPSILDMVGSSTYTNNWCDDTNGGVYTCSNTSCQHTNLGAEDIIGQGCDYYTTPDSSNQSYWCTGAWDDDDFTSALMCCQCGGGEEVTSSDTYGCSDIVQCTLVETGCTAHTHCCKCNGDTGNPRQVSAETYEWYIPEKFYTLTKIQMWKGPLIISGFKLIYERETETVLDTYPNEDLATLDGVATIEAMFGTTDLANDEADYEEITIPRDNVNDLIHSICLDFREINNNQYTDSTVLTGISLSHQDSWLTDGGKTQCVTEPNDIVAYSLKVYLGTITTTKKYELESRLVGFKMTTGILKSGNMYIRQLAPIVDETSCDVLLYRGNLMFFIPQLRYALGSSAKSIEGKVGFYTWKSAEASCQSQFTVDIETSAPSAITIQQTIQPNKTDDILLTTVHTTDESFLGGPYEYVVKIQPKADTELYDLQSVGIEYFDQKYYPDVKIQCNTDLEAGFPWTTSDRLIRCPSFQFDWSVYNYNTTPTGGTITAWNDCVPTGDGVCSDKCEGVPCDEIDLLCYRGWPFDSSQTACRDENGYNKDFSYLTHNFNTNLEGDTYTSYDVCTPEGQGGKFTSSRNPTPEICPDRILYLPACANQSVTFDIAYIAELAIGTSISDNTWTKVSSSGQLFDGHFKDGEFGLESYNNELKRLLSKPSSSATGRETNFSSGISFMDGILKLPMEGQDIDEQTITFVYPCEKGAGWDATCSSGTSYNVKFMIHDVCDAFGVSFIETQHYADVTLEQTYFHIHLCEIIRTNHEYYWQVLPPERVFLGANFDKGNVCGYSKAFVDVELSLTSYTNLTGDVLDLSQNEVPVSEYEAFGFSEDIYTNLLPVMFSFQGSEYGILSAQVATQNFTAVLPVGVYSVEVTLKAIGTRAGYCYETSGKLFEKFGSQWDGDTCIEVNTEECECGTCRDCDFDRGGYMVELLKEKLDLYVCEDCTAFPDWEANKYAIEVAQAEAEAEAARLAAQEEGFIDLTTQEGLFTSATNLFNEEYPMIVFVTEEESKEIMLTLAVDPLYAEITFVENFGQASKFTTFDRESGELLIEPGESMSGEYVLKLKIVLGSLAYHKTIHLSVQAQLTEEDTSSLPVSSTDDQALFIMPESSPIEVLIDEEFTFIVSQYITAGIGTKIDKVELMQLGDFSTYDQTAHVVKVMPKQLAQAGDYPFIVRVFDSQNRPQSQQFGIKVVLSAETEESEEVEEEQVATDEELATQEAIEDDPDCDEKCQYEIAQDNVVEEITLKIGDLQIKVELGELTSNEDAILELFENGILDLSTEEQQGVFGDILAANAEYKQQQRQLEELEARANGWTIPTPEPPSLAFENIEPTGKFGLFFNANVAGLQFLEKLNKGLASPGSVQDSDYRRLQDEDDGGFQLSNYLKFEIQSGGEDSAKSEQLAFTVMSAGLENSLLMFKLDFENPLLVSMGSNKDKMIATIVDGSFFSSSENGLPIEPGFTIEQLLPKMLPGEEFEAALQTAQTSVERATNTLVVGQIIITLVLAISLKAMFNLMNVIQVLSYIRFYTGWPAVMVEIFQFMDDAITLKPVSDPIFEYGQSQFEIANATLSDEGMRNAGVQDTQLLKSLGLFGVVVLVLILSVFFYFLMKRLNKKHAIFEKVKVKLEKKLFYSSFLRYMIVSNLKLNYTIWAFLIGSGSFATLSSSLKTSAYICVIIGICIYPIYLMQFMAKNQDRLTEPKMAQKFDTLYQGIYTDKLQALMYNSVFCVRRFLLVLVNVIFSPGFPLVNFEHNHYLYKNLLFILVQTIYVGYVWDTKPHTNNIFNKLEFINEGMIMLICYIMVAYTGIGPAEYIIDATTPIYLTIAITVIIIGTNFGVMFKMTFTKVKDKLAKHIELRKQKERQKHLEQSNDEKSTAVRKKEKSGQLGIIEEDSDDVILESYDAQVVAEPPVDRPMIKTLTHVKSIFDDTESESGLEEEEKEAPPLSLAQQIANRKWQAIMDKDLYGIGRDPNAPPEPEMSEQEKKAYKRLMKELMKPDDEDNSKVELAGYTFDFTR